MESISPTLKMLMSVRQNIEAGDSVRAAIRDYLGKNQNQCSHELSIWLANKEKHTNLSQMKIPAQRKIVFELFSRGLSGEPILLQITQLEEELNEAAKIELEHFATALPMKALLPLLLLQFPALLLLLFGPLLRQMLESF